MKQLSSDKRKAWHHDLIGILRAGIILLLLVLPFHAFLVIVFGKLTGNQLVLAAWKEVVVLVLAAAGVLLMVLDKNYSWLKHRTNYAVLGAIASGLIASLINWHFDITWLAGVKTTLLPLILFLTVQQAASSFDDSLLEKIVLLPALIVSAFAVWQFLAIPTTFLVSLGYSADTIIPFQSVHPGFDMARAFSTLGGPNQLGAYLILPATWLLVRALKQTSRKERLASAIGFSLVSAAITVSFSRSAILALGVAVATVLITTVPKKWRWPLIGVIATSIVAAWLGIQMVLDHSPGTALRSFVLRGELSATGEVIGGDQGHVESIEKGVVEVSEHPLGLGLGSVGPASFYGEQPKLTENWFLQIALELGLPGLVFVLFAFGRLLFHFHRKSGLFTTAMFASLIGLIVANLFLHSFADSTLGLTYFALAGIAIARPEEE